MNVKEVVENIKDSLSDRISNPLVGNFSLSWFLWNWKVPVSLIFGKESYKERIEYISDLYKDKSVTAFDWTIMSGSFLYLFFLPALSALLILFLLPIITKHCSNYYLSRQKELREAKRKIEESEVISIEDANVLRRQIQSLNKKLKTEIHEIESGKERIENQLHEKNEVLRNLESDMDNLRGQLAFLIAIFEKTVKNPHKDEFSDEELVSLKQDLEEKLLGFRRDSNLKEIAFHYPAKYYKKLIHMFSKEMDQGLQMSQEVFDGETLKLIVKKQM